MRGANPFEDPRIRADRCLTEQRWDEARRLLRQLSAARPADGELRVKLSVAERQCGDPIEAERHGRAAVRRLPKFFLAHQVLALALHAQGQLPKAIRSYRDAIALRPTFPDTYYLLATALQECGQLAESATAFARALTLRPDYAEAMAGLGGVRLALGEVDSAEHMLRAAVRLDPGAVEAIANLAAARELGGATEEAVDLYRRAIALAPMRGDLRAYAANSLERLGQIDAAKALLDGMDVAETPLAALAFGRIARRERRMETALPILDDAITRTGDPMLAGEMLKLTGQLLDELGRTDEAFARADKGNDLIAQALRIDRSGAPLYLDDVAQNRAEALTTPEWRPLPRPAPAPFTPCFLIGFPRSGTTLLEQMLDAHPRLKTIDEKPIVSSVVDLFRDMERATGTTLAALEAAQRDELRAAYFKEAARHLPEQADLVLDKLPLNLLHAPLLSRILPEARFVLALRHPLDVVLSCFMQSFSFNNATRSFLSLRHTAMTYRGVMAYWREIAARLPIPYHAIRYEAVVADPRTAIEPLLRFLSLDWDDGVLDHAAVVRAKSIINTPSYHQVARPLYSASRGKWERYRTHLGEATKILQEDIQAFDY